MDWLEALILGLIQGLTEFLPVSSSGHLELGKVILGVQAEESLTFTVVVHGATVLSTMVVFWREIWELLRGLFRFSWNEETKYIVKLIISAIPVAIVGLFFSEEVESLFTGNVLFVGIMLLITALLLTVAYFVKQHGRDIGFNDSFIIGVSQAFAVIPGISRSGITISTGLLLKNKKTQVAQFAFLMLLIPVIGANAKEALAGDLASAEQSINSTALIIGFITAFVSGLAACKWMIHIVKRGKLIYFAIYCLIIGSVAIIFSLMN